MATLQIHVIGLGIQIPVELPANAQKTLAQADCVIGWQRHQAMIAPFITNEQFRCVTKLTEVKKHLTEFEDNAEQTKNSGIICVLASGDPLLFGIGKWLAKQAGKHSVIFYPAISSVQAACHKRGVSLQDVHLISLHGRPLATLRTALKKNRTLVVLTDAQSQPQMLAKECIDAGFTQAQIYVYENLGYPQEQSFQFSVQALQSSQQTFAPLHVSLIEVKGDSQVTPEFPGIEDHLFATGKVPGKGMISKREVRLVILSYLQPAKDDVIWDIGAGCGGVAIELSYWNKDVQVHAIEYHPERLPYLKQNQQRFGVVKNLIIAEGKAPAALNDLPTPNKIFIGGSDGELETLLANAWAILPVGGLLVASAVIETTKQTLNAFCQRIAQQQAGQVESVELGVKRGTILNGELNYATKLPVEVFKFTKNTNLKYY